MTLRRKLRVSLFRFKQRVFDLLDELEDRVDGKRDGSGISMQGEGDGDPDVAQFVNSEFELMSGESGINGERVAMGKHWIPHGREIRLSYELDGDDRLAVIRQAFFDDEAVGEMHTERHDLIDSEEGQRVASPHDGPPDLPPQEWAKAHFYDDPSEEITDWFFICLDKYEDIEDYPVSPVELGA